MVTVGNQRNPDVILIFVGTIFSERIIAWWNKLDEETVAVTWVNSFKGKMQKLKANLDEFPFGHCQSDELYGQASFPGEANPFC